MVYGIQEIRFFYGIYDVDCLQSLVDKPISCYFIKFLKSWQF